MTTLHNRFFHLSLTGPAYGRLQEAEQFFLAGNLNEALAAAQQAWREHPQDSDVFRVLAYIHMARGEYEPAAKAGYQAVVVDDQNPASYATLCQVYITFNMLGNAEEIITLAQQRYPEDPSLLVLGADLRFRQHRDEEAARLARQALSFNPDDNYAKALLGVYSLRKRLFLEASALLADAVQAYPQRWDYLRDLGIAHLHLAQYADARKLLLESYRLNRMDQSTKQHAFFALRCAESRMSGYWAVSFFFFDYAWLGWILHILGWLALLVGFGWRLTFTTDIENLSAIPIGLFLGGLALVVLTWAGIGMHFHRRRKLDVVLWKALKQEAETSMPLGS